MPPRREGETGPRGATLTISLDHLASRSPAEEAALEEILLPAETSRRNFRGAPEPQFILEQWLEHADRDVERRARRAVRRLAVPAAVGQLLGEQPVDDAPDVLVEVRADRGHLSIDTGLHLTGEERIVITLLWAATLPSHAVADASHRATCLVARGIETHIAQEHHDVHRGIPLTVPCCAAPPPIGPLEGEQLRADALGGDPRALGHDLLRGRIGQVPHHLPVDRRIRIKQPLYDLSLWRRDLPFGWMGCHHLLLL